jgi:hypothetical protein
MVVRIQLTRVPPYERCEAFERPDRRRAHPCGRGGRGRVRRALQAARPYGARMVPPPAQMGRERPDRGDVRAGVALPPELPGRGRRFGAPVASRHCTQRRARVRPPERGGDAGRAAGFGFRPTSPRRTATRRSRNGSRHDQRSRGPSRGCQSTSARRSSSASWTSCRTRKSRAGSASAPRPRGCASRVRSGASPPCP